MGNPPQIISGSLPRLFGKYTLTRELGRGAMGMVFEARDSALDRRVALKLMLPSDNPDPKEAQLEEQFFMREAQLCGRLEKHPNIVSVYEAGSIENKRYIAMEYVDGVPLSDWTAQRKPSLRTRVRILREVAYAVHHAHRAGILHRDLKPKNVLIDPQGRPYVTDFGMAKRVSSSEGSSVHSSSSAAGTVVGTPSYMSPEQAQGLRKIDRRTDVYALGAMLYEILTGNPPFPGEMTIVALMRIVQDPIPPPSAASPEWAKSSEDKAVEGICMQALSKNPDDRFPDAMALADRLTRWLGDKPAAAPKKADEKSGANLRRIWIPAALLPVAIILLLIAAQISRSSPPPEPRWDQAEGLLALVDPSKDAVSGAWTLSKGQLVSGAAPRARVEIPWRPTAEYDLRVSFLRREGVDDVAILLPWKNSTFVWKAPPLENGAVHTATFRVRPDKISSLLSGPGLESHSAAAVRGPADPKWQLRDPSLLGLGASDSIVEFQRVEILEFAGKGFRARP
ncbi:MAG: serine/threonine protein kinase [Planctomycetes bacterium]|nr:serine/threonine protein kinase [Planctomycetota bacterium]